MASTCSSLPRRPVQFASELYPAKPNDEVSAFFIFLEDSCLMSSAALFKGDISAYCTFKFHVVDKLLSELKMKNRFKAIKIDVSHQCQPPTSLAATRPARLFSHMPNAN